MAPMDRTKYDALRRELDRLGYSYPLAPESVPLVHKLFSDFSKVKVQLEKVESDSTVLRKENEKLAVGIEPYRRENSRLVKDNLQLQKSVENLEERHEQDVRDLRREIEKLNDDVVDLEFLRQQACRKIKELEREVVERDLKCLQLASGVCHCNVRLNRIDKTKSDAESLNRATKRNVLADIENSPGEMAEKERHLNKKMLELRQDNCQLSELVVNLQKQVKTKDAELSRLQAAVDNSKVQERCCQCQQKDIMLDNLEHQVREALGKQHDAMSKAVQLAERNQVLERELKDLDNMCKSLEETYQRGSKQKEIESLQQRLEASQREIRDLETRLGETRDRHEKEVKISENLRKEKRQLEHEVSNHATEKKCLNEGLNKLIIVEKELREEIDKLKAANQTLHRRWSEKETWQQCGDPACRATSCPCKCPNPPRRREVSPPWKSRRLKEKTEPKFCGCAPSLLLMDKLQQERDYYHEECHMLRQRLCTKCNCYQTAENSRGRSHGGHEESLKLMLDRVERERDIALADLRRIQEERDSLRLHITRSSDAHSSYDAMRMSHLSAGPPINQMAERQCEELKSQLRNCQTELGQVNALYNQLKALHEQSERSNSGTHARLAQVEAELTHAQERLRDCERRKWEIDEKMAVMSREKAALAQNVAFVVKEKDEIVTTLDDKTERLVRMEAEVSRRDAQIADLNQQLAQQNKKFELTVSEKVSRDHAHRTLELTLERLRQELSEMTKSADVLRIENARIKEELSAALRDGHAARLEVATMTTKLQQYVTEVERAEELIIRKEREQDKLLSEFQTLTQETTSLETSNHTLEAEVEVTKMTVHDLQKQLRDLQGQLNASRDLNDQYEKQISSLTQTIAELEAALEVKTQRCCRLESDLEALMDNEHSKMSYEVRRLSEEKNGLSDALRREQSEVEALRESLSQSRQETLKHRSSNKDLTSLVHELRKKVDELTSRLDGENKDVRRYREQCTELSEEVTQLRRDITNLRFDTARSSQSHDTPR